VTCNPRSMSVDDLVFALTWSCDRRMEVRFNNVPIIWNVIVRSVRKKGESLTFRYDFPRISTSGGEWQDLSVKEEEMGVADISDVYCDEEDRIHFTWALHPEREYIVSPPDSDQVRDLEAGNFDLPDQTLSTGCLPPCVIALLIVTALVCALASLL
jgi:hypothetical protein